MVLFKKKICVVSFLNRYLWWVSWIDFCRLIFYHVTGSTIKRIFLPFFWWTVKIHFLIHGELHSLKILFIKLHWKKELTTTLKINHISSLHPELVFDSIFIRESRTRSIMRKSSWVPFSETHHNANFLTSSMNSLWLISSVFKLLYSDWIQNPLLLTRSLVNFDFFIFIIIQNSWLLKASIYL